jgi:hypothetical protein
MKISPQTHTALLRTAGANRIVSDAFRPPLA